MRARSRASARISVSLRARHAASRHLDLAMALRGAATRQFQKLLRARLGARAAAPASPSPRLVPRALRRSSSRCALARALMVASVALCRQEARAGARASTCASPLVINSETSLCLRARVWAPQRAGGPVDGTVALLALPASGVRAPACARSRVCYAARHLRLPARARVRLELAMARPDRAREYSRGAVDLLLVARVVVTGRAQVAPVLAPRVGRVRAAPLSGLGLCARGGLTLRASPPRAPAGARAVRGPPPFPGRPPAGPAPRSSQKRRLRRGAAGTIEIHNE
jgi:hypothetical protein